MILIGVDFNSAPIEVRENLYFDEDDLSEAYAHLRLIAEEVVILSTCNRVELYFHGAEGIEEKIFTFLKDYYYRSKKAELTEKLTKEWQDYFYFMYDREAITHLYEVSSSLHSLVVGENEILGQLKKAYEQAKLHKVTKAFFNKLFQGGIAIGKKVRSETNISKGGVSVSSTSVDLVKEVYKKNSQFSLFLIGAGQVAEAVVKSLASHGEVEVLICNRSEKNAKDLIAKYGGRWIPFEERYQEIIKSDVVISSTATKEYIVTPEKFVDFRDGCSQFIFFIDLSVPRDIDPKINDLEDTALYTVDDLQSIANRNIKARALNIGKVQDLIHKAVDDFFDWLDNRKKYVKN